MILGPSYKSPSATMAYENMKKATKREVVKFEDIIKPISAELRDKAVYMQRPEFWEDNHNKKMFDLGKNLGDIIAEGGNRVKEYFFRTTIKSATTQAVLNHILNK